MPDPTAPTHVAPPPPPLEPTAPPPWDLSGILQNRATCTAGNAAWAAGRPPSGYGYAASYERVVAAAAVVDDGEKKSISIPVKVYTPLPTAGATAGAQQGKGGDEGGGKGRPLLFLTHGGGFIQGDAVSEEIFFLAAVLERLTTASSSSPSTTSTSTSTSPSSSFSFFSSFPPSALPVVVSAEYRLAPEHPFPVPLSDSAAALEWALGNAKRLGIDLQRVVLGGSSAGAALTASLAATLASAGRGEGRKEEEEEGGLARVKVKVAAPEGFKVRGVVLNVPVLGHPAWWKGDGDGDGNGNGNGERGRSAGSKSYNEDFGDKGLTVALMRMVWDCYTPEKSMGGNWQASPLLADLAGFPPTHIFAAELDPNREDGLAFHKALEAAGAHSTVHLYEGMHHAFAEEDSSARTADFRHDMTAALAGFFSS